MNINSDTQVDKHDEVTPRDIQGWNVVEVIACTIDVR